MACPIPRSLIKRISEFAVFAVPQSCGKLKRPSELRRKKHEHTNPSWSISIHKPYRITWIPLSIWLKHIQRDDRWGPKQACAGPAFSPHSLDSPGKGNLRRWKDLAGDFLETLPGQRNYPQSTVIWLDNISPSPLFHLSECFFSIVMWVIDILREGKIFLHFSTAPLDAGFQA